MAQSSLTKANLLFFNRRYFLTIFIFYIATLDIAAALPIATSTPVTEASRYIQCALYKKIMNHLELSKYKTRRISR